MNIRQMQIFQTVCEENSFTKAAQKLHMTQPAISHSIHDLEEEMGTAMFERIGRKIYITAQGEELSVKVSHILNLYKEVEDSAGELEKRGRLRIGSSITIANFWLPQLLAEFQKKYPHISVKVEIDRAYHIEQKIRNNEIDIALMEGAIHYKELAAKTFSSYEMKVVCKDSHPFAMRKDREILPEELVREKLLLREKGSAIRDTLDSALLLHNLYADPVMTSVNSQALLKTVKQGVGVTVLPCLILGEDLEKNHLACVSIKDMPLHNYNCVVHHKDKFLSKPIQDLLNMIKETS